MVSGNLDPLLAKCCPLLWVENRQFLICTNTVLLPVGSWLSNADLEEGVWGAVGLTEETIPFLLLLILTPRPPA